MTVINSSERRLPIPRWLPYNMMYNKCELYYASSGSELKFSDFSEYNEKKFFWERNHNLYNAVELLTSALIYNIQDSQTHSAASFIKNVPDINSYLLDLANSFVKGKNRLFSKSLKTVQFDARRQSYQAHIARLKYLTKNYPHNPINWSDMAFYYATLGQDAHANKAMGIALYYGYHNRFIIRSAVRLFVHLGEFDRAFELLHFHPNIYHDPWLVAPEISLATLCEKSSSTIKKVIKTIDKYKKGDLILPLEWSEPASSASTIELFNGSNKKALRLAELASLNGNENSITQAEWVASELGKVLKRHHVCDNELFEADMIQYRNAGKFKKAYESAYHWLLYQPFAAGPAIDGSYIASSGLQDYQKAVDICDVGLRASPNNFLLLNNMTFAHGSLNNTQQAQNYINRINKHELNEQEQATYDATKGLLAYRTGDTQKGRDLYTKAIKYFEKESKIQLKRALLYWMREEKRVDGALYQQIKERLFKLLKNESTVELKEAYKKITGDLVKL